MSLRAQAEADLGAIVEDASGFGWPITVTAPTGSPVAMVGLSTDIGHTIDPQTGVAVTGRMASVALRISSLVAAGLGMPRGIDDATSKPWVVTFQDIGGTPHTFKIAEAMPDRALGVVVCTLEAYKP